ncbi:AAA family ATPase [Candidatus Dojkabacteria bacterium]|nr:AAA family ATPase [Candidatus Dojkabacteria bacterium]
MRKNHSRKQKLTLAFVGKNGAGKDTVVDHVIENYQMERISISDMVRSKATELSLPHTRENLNSISKDLIARCGNDYFARLAIVAIEESKSSHIAVPDIRSPQDVKTFRNAFGKRFVLIAVLVQDIHVRFERLVARGTARDPKSWNEFLVNEQREEEIFQIDTTVSLADYAISNNQNLSKLKDDVNLIASKLRLPKK